MDRQHHNNSANNFIQTNSTFLPLGLTLDIDDELIEAIQRCNANLESNKGLDMNDAMNLINSNWSDSVQPVHPFDTNVVQYVSQMIPQNHHHQQQQLIQYGSHSPPSNFNSYIPQTFENSPQSNYVYSAPVTRQAPVTQHHITNQFITQQHQVYETTDCQQRVSPPRDSPPRDSPPRTSPPQRTSPPHESSSPPNKHGSLTFVTYNPEEKHDKNQKVLVPYVNTHPKKSRNEHEHMMVNFKLK
jgi:hypothetical protein